MPCTYRDELLSALLQRLSPLLQQLSQGLHVPSIGSFMDDAVQAGTEAAAQEVRPPGAAGLLLECGGTGRDLQ